MVWDRSSGRVLRFSYVLVLVWFLLHLPGPSSGIRWLALHDSAANWTAGDACGEARRAGVLWEAQTRACRRQPAAMLHVAHAARLTRSACLAAHAHDRWNCSSVTLAPSFTPDLLTGTREQAYVYAMSAAALTWAVSRACAAGALPACSCAAPPRAPPRPSRSAAPLLPQQERSRFKWGGCGDNFKFADRFAKAFLDTHEVDTRNGKFENPIPPPPTSEPPPTPPAQTTRTSAPTTRTPAPTTAAPYVILVDDQPAPDNVTATPAPGKKKGRRGGRKRLPRSLAPAGSRRGRPKRKRYRYSDRAAFMRNMEYRMAADDPRFDPHVDLETRLDRLRTLIAAANVANLKYGRKTVSSAMYTKCTCHGVSGSCSVRTCWRALPPLAAVSAELVAAAARAGALKLRSARRQRPRLRYVTPSPDYCEPDATAGSLGTHGRWCNASAGGGSGGCTRLCCGRGRRVERTVQLERCRCKYHWCCRVDCQLCRTVTEEHYCN